VPRRQYEAAPHIEVFVDTLFDFIPGRYLRGVNVLAAMLCGQKTSTVSG
jgi:hypothetical protein